MVIIQDEGYESPFVKEVLAQSVTRAGLKPWQAFSFTSSIRDELLSKDVEEMSSSELADLVYKRLLTVDKNVAERYKTWREIGKVKREPLIIMIGGATGVGTTTIGTEVAHRMGIKNVIATDSIREIMRKTVSPKLLPSLHASSYNAHNMIKVPLSDEKNKDVAAFQLQVWSVTVGIESIIDRALEEGVPTVIEGVHTVPSFISPEYMKMPNVVAFMLHLKNESDHRSRFYARAFETRAKRSVGKYFENFKHIRNIQKYLVEQAKDYDLKLLENKDIEETVTAITDESLNRIIKHSKK